MNNKANILFTATFSTPFIREDLAFLRTHFTVTDVIGSGPLVFFRWLPALWKANITFSWFASVYSSILVLKGKFLGCRSIIVLGGVDAAKMPELNYGIWNSRWKSIIVRYGITHADTVLAVDDSLKEDVKRLAHYDGANIRVVPTGYDPNRWKPEGEKQQKVLTVAHCTDIPRARVKGIDFLAETARSLPDVRFLLIGVAKDIADQFLLPENVTVIGPVSQDELLKHYQSSAVYFQPSRREGLPNTLCEAMLCGCYPVGTRTGGIANAIGNTGSVVEFGNADAARNAVTHGLSTPARPAGRERIIQHFSQQQREEQLLKSIKSLTDAQ